MRIGILGSGLMGGKLGTIFARAAYERKGGAELRIVLNGSGDNGSERTFRTSWTLYAWADQ